MSLRPGLLALLLLLSAIATSAALNLAFTLPLFLLGLSLVAFSQARWLRRSLETRRGWNADSGHHGGDGWVGLVRCECRP